MPGRVARAVSVTPCQRALLEQIIRSGKSPQAHVRRARIIVSAADGLNNAQIAATLGMRRQRVSAWRERWAAACSVLCRIEAEEGAKGLRKPIDQVLSDAPRSGAPGKFPAEQVCQIIAVACEAPEAGGHPVSHWTPQALRLEILQRGIVAAISVRQVGRFLKRGGSQTSSGALLGAFAGSRDRGIRDPLP